MTGGRSQHHVRNASTGPEKVPPARDVYVERTPMLDYVTILEAGKVILDFVFEPSQQTKQKSNPGNRPMQQCKQCPWQFQTLLNQTSQSPLCLLCLLCLLCPFGLAFFLFFSLLLSLLLFFLLFLHFVLSAILHQTPIHPGIDEV